jgi:glycosyltransferase involved in cell wall biosynthesis
LKRKYVTAFAGRRDAYQVPLALAEADMLARFVTSFYLTSRYERALRAALPRIPAAASQRRRDGVDDQLVRTVMVAELLEQVGRRVGLSPQRYWPLIDRKISRAAGDEAARTQADLLLYEPYAKSAFTREYRGFQPRKILFHFHPHPDLEATIYAEDVRRHPPQRPWVTPDSGGQASAAKAAGSRDVWKLADLILCASSFTKRSLVHAGAPAEKCVVIPYGTETPTDPPERRTDGVFRALFVGTGIQRKGLHHLLTSWRRAKLPPRSDLTVVCRSIDPQLRDLVLQTPACRLVDGMNRDQLRAVYASSSVLVVPSLVEGFGQVYLESLSHGCPVLGTANTGLPDLGGEAEGIFLVEPCDVDGLTHKLECLASGAAFTPGIAHAAWRLAGRFTWPRFRQNLREAIA